MKSIKQSLGNWQGLSKEDRRQRRKEFLIDNSLYFFLIGAVIGIVIYDPRFLSVPSLVNILSLSAANLPIALGIAGCIILTGAADFQAASEPTITGPVKGVGVGAASVSSAIADNKRIITKIIPYIIPK